MNCTYYDTNVVEEQHNMLSVDVHLSFLAGDVFSLSRWELEGVMGMSNYKVELDAVVELCDCLLLARLASQLCQNGGVPPW
jgi:hypothetical protein